MNVQCLIGRHDLGPWHLYPRVIGAAPEWLRWERGCQRKNVDRRWICRHVERRWFPVRVPTTYRGPGIGKAIKVEEYLKRIGFRAPAPELLDAARLPPREAWGALLK